MRGHRDRTYGDPIDGAGFVFLGLLTGGAAAIAVAAGGWPWEHVNGCADTARLRVGGPSRRLVRCLPVESDDYSHPWSDRSRYTDLTGRDGEAAVDLVLNIRILGPVEAESDGVVVRLVRRQHRLLLGILALEVNRAVPADRLIELLWGDRPPRSARAVVQSRMSELRVLLAELDDGVPQVLRTVRDGYLLNVDRSRVDAHLFLELAAKEAAGTPPAEALDRLRRALGLWRGPVLGAWSSGEPHAALCQELEAIRLTIMERRFELELALGNMRAVADELLALSLANPGRERLAAQAMTALSAGDRNADAMGVYDRCRRWLADELGIDPGTELQQLHLTMLQGHAAGSPRAAAPAVLRAFQLPADVAHFVGRDPYLAVLEDLVDPAGEDGPRLVTVSGPPGVGKTALAVHLGQQLRMVFPDGQLFVNLRGYSAERPLSAEEVLHRFLRALGFAPEQIPNGRDEMGATYRSALADRRVLVVLDNAGAPEQVRPLLPGGGRCAVIVTSRDRMLGLTALDGARELMLGMLDAPEARLLLTGALGADRVDAEPAAAAELARLCGHLPLALRIAATNLTVRPSATIDSYVERLASRTRLRDLSIDGDDEAAVASAIDLSYQQLDAGAAAAFRLLGMVPGTDIDARAAAALVGLPLDDARPVIDRLVSRSLVQAHGRDRYQLHDLIRDYARDRAGDEDTPATRDDAVSRLFRHYLDVAGAATAVLYPDLARPAEPMVGSALLADADPTAALAWLDLELSNLLAAVDGWPQWAARPPVWLLAGVLYGFLSRQRHTAAWLRSHTAALAAAAAAGDPRAQAQMYGGLGQYYFQDAQSHQARTHFLTGLQLFSEVGDLSGQARCHHGVGVTSAALGDYADAAEQLGRARDLLVEAGADRLIPGVECNLGNIYGNAGDLPAALRWLISARRAADRSGLGNVAAWARSGAGFVHSLRGEWELALSNLDQALELWMSPPNKAGQAEAWRFSAAVHLERGRTGDARALAERSWRQAETINDPWLIMGARLVLGESLLAVGEVEQAARHFLDIRDGEPEGWRQYRNWATVGLAACRRRSGDLLLAEALAREAAEDRRPYIRALAVLELARVSRAAEAWPTTAEHAAQAARTARAHGFRLVEARGSALLGLARLRGGDEVGLAIRDRALSVLADLGAPEDAGSPIGPMSSPSTDTCCPA